MGKNLLLYCPMGACKSTAWIRCVKRGGECPHFLSHGPLPLEEGVIVEWLSLVNSIKPLSLCRGDLNERFHSLATRSVWDQRTQSLVLQSSSCNSTCRDPASQSHRSCGSQPEWPGTWCRWIRLSGLMLIHASRSLQMAIDLA